MEPTTALIIAGEDAFAHKAALCLATAGITVFATSPWRAPALRWSRHVTGVHRLEWELFDQPGPELVDRINAIAAEVGATILFPADENPVRAVAAVAHDLSLPSIAVPSADAFETCVDKYRFSTFCTAHGLPQPLAVHLVHSPADIPADLAFPVIAKPPEGGGGLGVVRLDSREDLVDRLEGSEPHSGPPLLIQDFVPGIDIDCSFLAEGGEIVAAAVQTRTSMTDRTVRFVDRPDVVEVCARLAQAMHYDGLAHVDLRIDERDDSVRLIELNPRVWGSIAYAMQAGINFPKLAVDRALRSTSDEPTSLAPVAVTNTPVSASMMVRSLLRRGAPEGMSPPDVAAWEANAHDPLPSLAIYGRQYAQRVLGRIRSLTGRS